MEFRLLGPLEVVEGGRAVGIKGAKQRALLAALLVNRGETVTSDRLIDLLWGDDTPSNPQNALQAQVSQLRRTIGDGAIVTRGNGYVLDVSPDQIDAMRFEALATRGRRLLDDGDAAAAYAVLTAALSLWRGEALADVEHAGRGDLARIETSRLEEVRLTTLEARVETDLALGRHTSAAAELDGLTGTHPLRERLWALRMIALYRSGRQADALRAYAEARATLVEELGLEPGPELQRLEAMVLAQDPALDVPEPAGRAGAGPSDTPSRRTNVRLPLSRFIGRASERRSVAEALRENRLVTLVGPGGAGKTRLAVEMATEMTDVLPDGTWFADLAPLADPASVAVAIAAALGVSEARDPSGGGRPGVDTIERVVDHVAGRSLLIVVDNCEHVVAEVAALTDKLLSVSPGLRVLATSREALGLPGEALVAIGPLRGDEAVELFADRARAVQPSFELDGDTAPVVEEICGRLDGLPLAIELAAARTRALPVSQLATRLSDRFHLLTGGSRTALPRQQTLRAVVDWSYDLLFDDEKRMFARLSVFTGGCTLDAVEDVCADDVIARADVLELVSRLVDKSLVVATTDAADEVRYSLLQTLWEYAREKLVELGEADEVRARHAAWFGALAEEGGQGLRGRDSRAWRRRLRAEIGNLRAALEWLVEHGQEESALVIATHMAWLWWLLSDPAEGLRWLDDALDEATAPPRLRALALAWIGMLGGSLGDPHGAARTLERGVAELRREGDRSALGDALLMLASNHTRTGDLEAGMAAVAEARDVLEGIGSTWGLGVAGFIAATFASAAGRIEEAETHARSSVSRFRECGDEWGVVEALLVLGMLEERRVEYDAALAAYEEALEISRRLDLAGHEAMALVHVGNIRTLTGDAEAADGLHAAALRLATHPLHTAFVLNGRGLAARRLGEVERARRYHDEALSLYRSLESVNGETYSLAALGWCAYAAGDADSAERLFRDSLARARASALPQAITFAVEGLAGAAALRGDGTRAARLLGATASERMSASSLQHLPPNPDVEDVRARALAILGEDAFARAFDEGAVDPGVAEKEIRTRRHAPPTRASGT